jgi:glycosyltransferase involved in cell wall biosynthesis
VRELSRGLASSPSRVLEVFQTDVGDVPRYVEGLALGLLAEGWVVSVACSPDTCVAKGLGDAGVELLPLEPSSAPPPLCDLRAVRDLVRWSREREVSLLHGHGPEAGPLVAMAGRIAGIPSVYTPHGWTFERPRPIPVRFASALAERQFALRYHAAVLTASESGRTAAERWHVTPRGRIQVVGSGLPARPGKARSSARRALGLDERRTVAGWVGRVSERERPHDLAPIARRLADEVTVVALCDGLDGTELEEELLDAGVVIADPAVGSETVYAAANIMLHTSQWADCPLVVFEAMSARLPVVAYSVGGVAEQVRPGRTGHLVQRGDIEMLCRCVLSLARHPDLRMRMGDASRRRAIFAFSHQATVERVRQAYLSTAATGSEVVPSDSFHRLLNATLNGGSRTERSRDADEHRANGRELKKAPARPHVALTRPRRLGGSARGGDPSVRPAANSPKRHDRPIKLSILMPVYNEERTLRAAIDDVLIQEYPAEFELRVIDDGSTDATVEILDSIRDPRMHVDHHPRNLGKGAAVMTGAATATGTHMVPFDGDLEYSAADLPRMLAPIIAGRCDVVFGTRMFGMNTSYQSLYQALGNRALTTAANLLFNTYLTDIHTCLKMIPLALFRALELREARFGLDAELAARILQLGIRPFEVPVSYHGRSFAEGKKITWLDGLHCLGVLARVRRGHPGDLRTPSDAAELLRAGSTAPADVSTPDDADYDTRSAAVPAP